MTYRTVWLKGQSPIDACEFEALDDAKEAAEGRLANYRKLFGATAVIVEDAFGGQVHFHCSDGD